jgi:SAM-dependent methyltransferase
VYPITNSVPSFVARNDATAEKIGESFSLEWSHFDYESDKTWGAAVEARRRFFPKQIDVAAEELSGKVVLDAGCGNGTLANAITSYGCRVLAADISNAVERAAVKFANNEELLFVQADIARHPFRSGAFDIVFCGGVLHHTANTHESFKTLARAVAPGGTYYVWLYKSVPSKGVAARLWLRKRLSVLPGRIKHFVVVAFIWPVAMIRQYWRMLRGKNPPLDELRWRERLVILLDSYTPHYRWEHTPEEVHGWYAELGFRDVSSRDMGDWGFGVAGRRPRVD